MCPACAATLPATATVELGGCRFYLVHSVQDLFLDPSDAGIDVVVSGHSHRAGVEMRHGVLYLNPGSAGPRRFDLPVTLAKVTVDEWRGEARALCARVKCLAMEALTQRWRFVITKELCGEVRGRGTRCS